MPSDPPQLKFWRGDFGDDYTGRNAASEAVLRARTAMWTRLLQPFHGDAPRSVLEVGANIGVNLMALHRLMPAELYALEPNDAAREKLIATGVVPEANVMDGSADAIPLDDGAVDLAFTSGVLIHIAPENLLPACKEIHRVARTHIACIEYFATEPEAKPYRGHEERLFKRDFGGYWLDTFADLELVDYGFFWRRATGLDNLTWWLFRKA